MLACGSSVGSWPAKATTCPKFVWISPTQTLRITAAPILPEKREEHLPASGRKTIRTAILADRCVWPAKNAIGGS